MQERVEHFLETIVAEEIQKIVNYNLAIVINIHDDIEWDVLKRVVIN
jgi:hypothetical protein